MNDNAEQSQEVVDVVTQNEIDYKALYEETQKQLETVAAHKDKLYQETKKAKEERQAAELERQRIESETAKKNGEFEKLWQQSEKEKQDILNDLQNTRKGYRGEKIDVTAMRIATDLADGDNAELLKTFVKTTLDSLADETGSLSDDVIQGVIKEYKNNQKYKALLRGSKAVGGGAPGNASSAQATSNVVDRSTFDTWTPLKQMSYIKSGGRTVDSLN